MSGYLLRRDQRQERAGSRLCECGHPLYLHREAPATIHTIVDGVLVSSLNPAYRPRHFRCGAGDCACVRVPS